jgi:hypothetical protein
MTLYIEVCNEAVHPVGLELDVFFHYFLGTTLMSTSSLFSGLNKIVKETLTSLEIYGNGDIQGWSQENAQVLASLVHKNVITRHDVSMCIHARLLEIGRACYEDHKKGEYPDHTISPSAFAYTLKHYALNEEEEKSIRFDHGQTAESFIQTYEQNIAEKVLKKLLGEQSLFTFEINSQQF